MASIQNDSSSSPQPPLSKKIWDFLPACFFAALFFLSSADLFFSIRIHDMNFRFGQALLLLAVLTVLFHFLRSYPRRNPATSRLFKVLAYWIPFFILYAAAAIRSDDPPHTFLKWGWALFNIGGSIAVCLSDWPRKNFEKGIYGGILALAAVLWAQFALIYWLPGLVDLQPPLSGEASAVSLHGLLLGYAQDSGLYNNTHIYRPNAFFYEPSYAGCALSFAFPLCLAWGLRGKAGFTREVLVPAMVLMAAWMTSSRSAIIGVLMSLSILIGFGIFKKRPRLLKAIGKIVLAVFLFSVIFTLSTGSRSYFGFMLGPLGPKAVLSRLPDSASSEGWRLENVLNSLKLWEERPLLGRGVIPSPFGVKALHGMGQTSESMWLEVGVESGLLGFLAFVFAIFRTIRVCAQGWEDIPWAAPVLAALAVHLAVNMNFTSTFPRLDYWILFFFGLRLLTDKEENASPA